MTYSDDDAGCGELVFGEVGLDFAFFEGWLDWVLEPVQAGRTEGIQDAGGESACDHVRV